MKRVLGIIIAVLILGFGLSPGIFMAYAAAAQSAETVTSAYVNFWRILNQEAELVVSVEDGNLSAVPSLISNSVLVRITRPTSLLRSGMLLWSWRIRALNFTTLEMS